GRKVNGKALTNDIALNAGDVGAYNRAETDSRVNDVRVLASEAKNTANSNANGRVPAGRKVNGKALTNDIALNAGDVGAYNRAETD
ncbi:phage tail protein, partial [Xenorhabdus bovienii]|nr:phage tail protein [Xenorhabdus bovienii]